MRVRVLLKFAKILMLSRLRNTRRSFLSNSITNRPLLIALIGSIMFAAGVGFGIATVSFLRGAGASTADIGLIVETDRKSTRLNSSHVRISYAVFCLQKKNNTTTGT